MSEKSQNRRNTTRHLSPENVPPVAPRGTGPLDYMIPWVIELRILGTADVIQIEVAESIIVGRSDKKKDAVPAVDLEPYNAYFQGVSRQHAVISARNSRITVRDLGSSNGTYLNAGRLEPGKEYRLRHGDEISFGKLRTQVFFVVTPSSYEKNETQFDEINIPIIGSGQRVLILDEDEKTLALMGSVLEQAGFACDKATAVSQALIKAQNNMPTALVLELMLSQSNALDLVRYIRSQDGGDDVPIVVVTGVTGGFQMGQAIDAGVDVFITKPVGIDELLRSFSKIVEHMG